MVVVAAAVVARWCYLAMPLKDVAEPDSCSKGQPTIYTTHVRWTGRIWHQPEQGLCLVDIMFQRIAVWNKEQTVRWPRSYRTVLTRGLERDEGWGWDWSDWESCCLVELLIALGDWPLNRSGGPVRELRAIGAAEVTEELWGELGWNFYTAGKLLPAWFELNADGSGEYRRVVLQVLLLGCRN